MPRAALVDAVVALDQTEDDETEWEAELPPPTAEDMAAAVSESLGAQQASDEDLDLLWDWVRVDADRGKAFLDIAPPSSRVLREQCALLGDLYLLRESLPDGPDVPVGFAAFNVAGNDGAQVDMRVYFEPSVRPRAEPLLRQLMELAANSYPVPRLHVQTPDVMAARMLRRLGWTVQYDLTYRVQREEVVKET